eukprot:3295209-Rhodomonas_salina.4
MSRSPTEAKINGSKTNFDRIPEKHKDRICTVSSCNRPIGVQCLTRTTVLARKMKHVTVGVVLYGFGVRSTSLVDQYQHETSRIHNFISKAPFVFKTVF